MPICGSKLDRCAAERGLGTGAKVSESISLRSALHLTASCAYEAQSSPNENMAGGCCQKEDYVRACN